MPYSKADILTVPNNDDVIWRYMPICRFESLLESGLFLTSLQHLKVMDGPNGDPYEGELTSADLAKLKPDDMSEEEWQGMEKNFAQSFYVSCWTCKPEEESELWINCVGENKDGVAIRSTFSKMQEALQKCQEDVQIGLVRYENFDSHTTGNNALELVFLKREDYKRDCELRLAFTPPIPHDNEVYAHTGQKLSYPEDLQENFGQHREAVMRGQKGYVIKNVDMSKLIMGVHLAPWCSDGLKDQVVVSMKRADLDPKLVAESILRNR